MFEKKGGGEHLKKKGSNIGSCPQVPVYFDCLFPQSFSSVKIQILLFCNDFRHVFDIAIMQN